MAVPNGATRRAGASRRAPTVSTTSATRSVSPGRFSTGTRWAASSPWSTRSATPSMPGRWCSSPHSPASTCDGSSRSSVEPAATRWLRSSSALTATTVRRSRRRRGPLLEALRAMGFGRAGTGSHGRQRRLDEPGLEVMRGFDVLDQLARIECPTLVCVGELDPITRSPPPERSPTPCPRGSHSSQSSRVRATSPGRTPRTATGRCSWIS